MIKYQNGEYIYLYPPLLLIIIKQMTKVLTCVYFSYRHVVIIIYLQKQSLVAVLLQIYKHLVHEIL